MKIRDVSHDYVPHEISVYFILHICESKEKIMEGGQEQGDV